MKAPPTNQQVIGWLKLLYLTVLATGNIKIKRVCFFCKRLCPIPISSVPISSTSGTSKSSGLTLTLQNQMKLGKENIAM